MKDEKDELDGMNDMDDELDKDMGLNPDAGGSEDNGADEEWNDGCDDIVPDGIYNFQIADVIGLLQAKDKETGEVIRPWVNAIMTTLEVEGFELPIKVKFELHNKVLIPEAENNAESIKKRANALTGMQINGDVVLSLLKALDLHNNERSDEAKKENADLRKAIFRDNDPATLKSLIGGQFSGKLKLDGDFGYKISNIRKPKDS